MSTAPEAFVPLNGSAGNSAPVTGGRRHRSKKQLKLVTRRQARKLLKKLGKKMRGGAPTDAVVVPTEMDKQASTGSTGSGRRRTKKHRKSKRSLFGY
jgi:hypothetical protein